MSRKATFTLVTLIDRTKCILDTYEVYWYVMLKFCLSYVNIMIQGNLYFEHNYNFVKCTFLKHSLAPDFKNVQKEVSQLIQGRILIGHAIHHDLKVLLINRLPACCDEWVLSPHRLFSCLIHGEIFEILPNLSNFGSYPRLVDN